MGKFICLGDLEMLKDKGIDPDACPACKASLENAAAVDGPRRRFVVHVIKYQTTKGTFNLQKPFQVELVAWEFTENRFTTLVDIKEEHGNLPGIDLCLGPCTNKGFQKYDIIPGGSCQWGADDDRKAKTREVVSANRSEDLTPLLGRNVSDTELRSEVNEVIRQYNYAFGRHETMPVTANTNVDNDLSDMLSDPTPAADPIDPTSPEALSGETLIDFGDNEPAAQPKESEPPKQGTDEIEDLETLLSKL